MVVAGCCRYDVANRSDEHRRVPRGPGSIPQLSIAVISPSPQRPVAFYCQGVQLSGRHRHHAASDSEPAHCGGCHTICVRPVPNLPVAVISPTPDASVCLQRQRVRLSGRHTDHPADPGQLFRNPMRAPGCSQPKPSVVVVPERPNLPVPGERQTVITPCSHIQHCAQPFHFPRLPLVAIVAQPELPIVVASPCPHTSSQYGHAVEAAGNHLAGDNGRWRQNLQCKGRAARASRVGRTQGNRGVANHCRRAADHAACGVERQPGGKSAGGVACRVVVGCDLVAEGRAHRGVGRQRTRDGGRRRKNSQRQSRVARASRVGRTQGNRGVTNRCRRAVDQPARGVECEPNGKSAGAVACSVIAGCDLVAESRAHCGIGTQRTRNGGG